MEKSYRKVTFEVLELAMTRKIATLCSNAYLVTHGQIVHCISLQMYGFERESRIREMDLQS